MHGMTCRPADRAWPTFSPINYNQRHKFNVPAVQCNKSSRDKMQQLFNVGKLPYCACATKRGVADN